MTAWSELTGGGRVFGGVLGALRADDVDGRVEAFCGNVDERPTIRTPGFDGASLACLGE